MKRFLGSLVLLLALGSTASAAPLHLPFFHKHQKPAKQAGLRLRATLHSTALSWTASVTSPVTYNVYRCTVAPCAAPTGPGPFTGPWASLSTGINGLTFTDSNVTAGQTASYVATASCTLNGAAGCGTTANPITGESTASNLVTATTPNNPVVPGAPTLTLTGAQ